MIRSRQGTLRRLAAAAVAALALGGTGGANADTGAEERCKPDFVDASQAGAGPRLKGLTQALWAEQVEQAFGAAWSQWERAASQRTTCSWTLGAEVFLCTVRARPCRADGE
jgi:hypothetical protein